MEEREKSSCRSYFLSLVLSHFLDTQPPFQKRYTHRLIMVNSSVIIVQYSTDNAGAFPEVITGSLKPEVH